MHKTVGWEHIILSLLYQCIVFQSYTSVSISTVVLFYFCKDFTVEVHILYTLDLQDITSKFCMIATFLIIDLKQYFIHNRQVCSPSISLLNTHVQLQWFISYHHITERQRKVSHTHVVTSYNTKIVHKHKFHIHPRSYIISGPNKWHYYYFYFTCLAGMITNNCTVLKGTVLGQSPDGTMLKLSFVNTGQTVPKLKLRQRDRQHGKLINLHLVS